MRIHLGLSHRGLAIAALLGLTAWAPAGYAATFKVGTGANCTQGTIAEAVAASEMSDGPDTIRVTRSATYTQQAINFNVTQEVTITGGYADCDTNVEDGTYTTLDGSGGNHATVMAITGGVGSAIYLRKLTITGGNNDAFGAGGISYSGAGLLDIADSTITTNSGGAGGGISAAGTDDAAKLHIGDNTLVVYNTARFEGGGINLLDIQTTIRGQVIAIYRNQALGNVVDSYGGGIAIRACDRDTTVYLGSPGLLGLGVVAENSAKYGGGISIRGGCLNHGRKAQLQMFSIDASNHTKIQANTASIAGGGVYVEPYSDFPSTGAIVYVWNADIDENTAPEGAAFFLDTYDSFQNHLASEVHFNTPADSDPPRPEGAVDCALDTPCGEISGNAVTLTYQIRGAVISGDGGPVVDIRGIKISENTGNFLYFGAYINIFDSLIFANTTESELLEAYQLLMTGTTVVGNVVGGSHVISTVDGGASISNSIVWQPGVLTLDYNYGIPDVRNVISNNLTGLQGPGFSGILIEDPRFVDPGHGDYSLTAASPAVDFAGSNSGDHDLFSNPRDVDLAIVPNLFGPRDIGALERQTLQPLVLNSSFDANVNLWPEVTVGASSWDGTQNIAGPSGSGALHVLSSGNSVSARKQCIHLPGPGTYTLNGWGKSTGTITAGSYVSLGWEYRSAGSETCTGTVTASGSLLLANHATWRRPTTPATIVASNSEWTTFSSILVYLVVEDGGGIGGQAKAPSATLNGWFDGITLDVSIDRIFANGFQ